MALLTEYRIRQSNDVIGTLNPPERVIVDGVFIHVSKFDVSNYDDNMKKDARIIVQAIAENGEILMSTSLKEKQQIRLPEDSEPFSSVILTGSGAALICDVTMGFGTFTDISDPTESVQIVPNPNQPLPIFSNYPLPSSGTGKKYNRDYDADPSIYPPGLLTWDSLPFFSFYSGAWDSLQGAGASHSAPAFSFKHYGYRTPADISFNLNKILISKMTIGFDTNDNVSEKSGIRPGGVEPFKVWKITTDDFGEIEDGTFNAPVIPTPSFYRSITNPQTGVYVPASSGVGKLFFPSNIYTEENFNPLEYSNEMPAEYFDQDSIKFTTQIFENNALAPGTVLPSFVGTTRAELIGDGTYETVRTGPVATQQDSIKKVVFKPCKPIILWPGEMLLMASIVKMVSKDDDYYGYGRYFEIEGYTATKLLQSF